MLPPSSAPAAVCAALALALVPASVWPEPVPRNETRALTAYTVMQRYFVAQHGLYREQYPAGGSYSHAWPFSQAFAATLSLARVPGLAVRLRPRIRSHLAALRRYSSPRAFSPEPAPPFGRGGDEFYDDNEWIAQDLVEFYRQLGDRSSLVLAERLFAFVTRGWDRSRQHACPGGVYWTSGSGSQDRNAVSTANGALLALGLYSETGQGHYLRWGATMYGWVLRCLSSPDGLVWDHLTPTGAVDRTIWSYNQGAMIAAGAELFHATGRHQFLDRAQALAQKALAYFGANDFEDEPAYFAAIFFRDLKVLDEAAPDPDYAAAAQRYADQRWARRDPKSGLFWDGDVATLLDNSALIDLYAELAW